MIDRGGDITSSLGPKEMAQKVRVYGGVDWPNGESHKAEITLPLWMILLAREEGSRMTEEEYLKVVEFLGRDSGLIADDVKLVMVEIDEL